MGDFQTRQDCEALEALEAPAVLATLRDVSAGFVSVRDLQRAVFSEHGVSATIPQIRRTLRRHDLT